MINVGEGKNRRTACRIDSLLKREVDYGPKRLSAKKEPLLIMAVMLLISILRYFLP